MREQLGGGGRLLARVGTGGVQEIVRITRRGAELAEEHLAAASFVPLIGRHGI